MVQKHLDRAMLAFLAVTVAMAICSWPAIADAQNVTEFPIPSPASGDQPIAGVAAGSDGALWFTEPGANKIGRITTAGTITEYAIPTSRSVPVGIAAGSDGALWFAEGIGNKIRRVTTAGTFTEYVIPTSPGTPIGIAAGPDGAL